MGSDYYSVEYIDTSKGRCCVLFVVLRIIISTGCKIDDDVVFDRQNEIRCLLGVWFSLTS